MKKVIEIAIPTIFVIGIIGIFILYDKCVSDERKTTNEVVNSVYNQNNDTIYTETTTTSTNTTETTKTTKKVLKTSYITYDIQEEQEYAKSLFSQYGWTDSDFQALVNLWNKESGWNPNAINKSSGACGIPQALPCSKIKKQQGSNDWKAQIRWGLTYISYRYETPTKAWKHFKSKGWY